MSDDGATRALPEATRWRSGFAGISRPRWHVIAMLVFVLAAAFCFRALFGASLHAQIPVTLEARAHDAPAVDNLAYLGRTDARFVVWLFARGAHALRTGPLDFFEAAICHPEDGALALGESGLALSLLALLVSMVDDDPVFLFNAVLVLSTLIAAWAMYLLVSSWSACPPAGIAAGILYGFHLIRVGDPVHIMIWDATPTVFALYFALRLFDRGRLRDALGVVVSIGVQLGASPYSTLASVMIGLPFLLWLLRSFGLRAIRPWIWAFMAISIALLALVLLSPYFSKSAAGEYAPPAFQAFFSLFYVVPGGPGFVGFAGLLLAVLSLMLGASRSVCGIRRDPRWILLFCLLLVISVSVVAGGGPGQRTFPIVPGEPPPPGFFNLYLFLSKLIPGLGVGRGPGVIYVGAHLLLSLLAGLGAASLLRVVPERWSLIACAAIIAVLAVDVLRPRVLGLEPTFEYTLLRVRPDDDALAIHEALRRLGNAGPVLDYPINHMHLDQASRGTLLSAYHRRRTAWCYNSVLPRSSRRVEALARALPAPDALAALADLGFTTLLHRHVRGEMGGALHAPSVQVMVDRESGPRLRELARNASYSAYAIEVGAQ